MTIAYAQSAPITQTGVQVPSDAPPVPDAGISVLSNLGFVAMIVVMFYFLLIRPQQKRFKEHANMLSGLKKGDKVVTNGGLIGKIERIDGNDEVIVDLGSGQKVTALRSAIQSKTDKAPAQAAAEKKPATKKAPAKKAPAKKADAKKEPAKEKKTPAKK